MQSNAKQCKAMRSNANQSNTKQCNAKAMQSKAKQCKATKQDAFNNAFGLSLTKAKKNLIGVAPGSFGERKMMFWLPCAGVGAATPGPANLCWCGYGGSRASKFVLVHTNGQGCPADLSGPKKTFRISY